MIQIYEIPKAKIQEIKSILESQDQADKELDVEIEKEQGKGKFEKAKSWKVNEFRKQGYILREAKAIGMSEDTPFLYIKGDEGFFKRNEKTLIDAGAKRIEGKKFEKVKDSIEKQEEEAASGVGFIFG